MKTLLQILTEKFSNAFKQCGYQANFGIVTISDRLDLCQFQCNCAFAAAKIYKKAPFIIADEIIKNLEHDIIFKSLEVVKPGFINIIVQDDFLLELFNKAIASPNFGILCNHNETIVLDYGGPNVAKPLHIGHMRTAIIGESLKRLAVFLGNKVISDVHLGDWGLPMGLVIAELNERYPDYKCFSSTFNPMTDLIPEINVDELNEIYPLASKKSSQNDQFKEKAQQITNQLQNGHLGYLALWQKIINISKEDMKKNYHKLNVSFDYWYGESDSEKYIPELIEQLKKENLLYESEGALVVNVALEDDKAYIPPVIIKKSNHASVYATTDLATIIQRNNDFKPNKIWYVVDIRQSLHFQQVFRCAKKAHLVSEEVELEHVANGTINGMDGKPYKTRDGGVMQLSHFLDLVNESLLSKMENNFRINDSEKDTIAQKLAVAAVKFGDLINYRVKDYIFDIDKFTSPDGKTGIYVLYTITRIKSILKKISEAEIKQAKIDKINSSIEREIIINILQLNEIFNKAFNEKALNLICENVYQLAVLFTKFYHENYIISEKNFEKKLAWIKLLLSLYEILNLHIQILGIEAVEVM